MVEALVHHSGEAYAVAAERAAGWATKKLEDLIAKGRDNAKQTLEYVDTHQPVDAVCSAQDLAFSVQEGLKLWFHGRKSGIHRNALIQMAEKAGLPSPTALTDFLSQPHQVKHLAGIFQDQFQKTEGRYLIRSLEGQVRGFLSDKYRRLDSRPMIAALVDEAVNKYHAVPVEAKALDTSVYLKLIMPEVYEPVPNEVGVFGLCFRTSDYGHGRLWLKGFFYRLWCTNLAMTEDGLSQIHLGSRLSDEIEFSRRTMELDTETMASAIQDVTRMILSPTNIQRRLTAIQTANEEIVNADETLLRMRNKSRITKAEEKDIKEAFASADIENLPAGSTKWRLSNAISLLAQKAEPDRALELENMAGQVAGLHLAKDVEKELN